jgi:6-phosphogluconolactonase
VASPSDLIVVDSPAEFAGVAAAWIRRRLDQGVATRGSASIALSGGTTPRAVYEELSHLPAPEGLPGTRVSVYFGDERAVPPSDSESNYRMARESLLERVPIPSNTVHRMMGEAADLDRAALEYEQLLPDSLDLLLLGIGNDGHTASLFPHSAAVGEHRRRVVATNDGPPPVPRRLTITPPVIAAARQVVVLAAGAAKAEAVARALEGPLDPRSVPAQLVRNGTWILDRPAATQLRGNRP